jgi:hypothetical protein
MDFIPPIDLPALATIWQQYLRRFAIDQASFGALNLQRFKLLLGKIGLKLLR